ncbi:MAG: hypothetical protein ACFFBI_02285 [Promethearchaeota archaeon]
MGKEKKAPKIKTTRYFTKKCSKCGSEYPNWFTNCPKCGAAWDEMEAKAASTSPESQKKTIKIVVKITEEDFNRAILSVNLIFSVDQGKSWYQMEMDSKIDYYLAEIAEIPAGAVVIYYIEIFLENGEKIIENNENKYYYYNVGTSLGEPEEKPSNLERRMMKEKINESEINPQQYTLESNEPQKTTINVAKQPIKRSNLISHEPINPSVKNPPSGSKTSDLTIFGKPQTKIDPDLKVCSYCNSKIKKIWSTCPICGKNI